VNVEVTPLPGIGVRKDFALRDGRRIGVVTTRDGKLSLILSKADDPDATLAELPLSVDEAGALANLLGAPQLVEQLSKEHRDVPGIRTGRLGVAAASRRELSAWSESSVGASRSARKTSGVARPNNWISVATRAVQPVWWLAPSPAPLSP